MNVQSCSDLENNSQSKDIEKIDSNVYLVPLRNACMKGEMHNLSCFVKHKSLLEHQYEDQKRPIHLTVENKRYECVVHLIEEGCDIESEDECKMRPIHFACQNGDENIVKLLIEKKCDIECETKDGNRPFHYACSSGHANIITILLDRHCDVYCKNVNNETPLTMATKLNHDDCAKIIKTFIKAEVVQCIRDNDEKEFDKLYNKIISDTENIDRELSVLDIADLNGSDKIINYLMQKKLDDEEFTYLTRVYDEIKNVDANTLLGEMILYRCIRDRHTEGFHKFCLSEIVNGPNNLTESSFLSIVSKEGCSIFVNELLKKTIYNKETWDLAINEAIKYDHNNIAEDIKDRGSIIESRLERNFSLLHTAVCDNDEDMVRYILEKNILDPNINHETFGTALALAHSLCHRKCINVLQQFNVNTNTQNKFMQTPLHEAIASGTFDQSEYLIERCDNIDREGFNNLTALHCAVLEGRMDWCDKLAQCGADCTRNCVPSSTIGRSFLIQPDAEEISTTECSYSSVEENQIENDTFPSYETCVPSSTIGRSFLIQPDAEEISTTECSYSSVEENQIENDTFPSYETKEIFKVDNREEDLQVNNETLNVLNDIEIRLNEKIISSREILEMIEKLQTNIDNKEEICKGLLNNLTLLYDQSHNDIPVQRISWLILLSLCSIDKNWINYQLEDDFFMKYFDENFSLSFKLAVVVAHCRFQESYYDRLEEIIIFLFEVLRHFYENDEPQECFGFTMENIITCMNSRFAILINLYIMDKGFVRANSTYKCLKGILDHIDLCQDVPVLLLMNAVTNSFLRNCKKTIEDKIRKETNLEEEDRLVINCLHISLMTVAAYIENNLTTDYSYNDYIIKKIFETFSDYVSKSAIMMRICEAILYLLCSALKIRNKKIDYEFWNERLRICFEDETLSGEIRLAACVGLVEINSIRNLSLTVERRLKLLNYLFKVVMIEGDKGEYLGFKKEEIIKAIENAVKIVTTFSQKIFCPNEGLDIRLNYLNDFLCLVLRSHPKRRSDYSLPIVPLAHSSIKSFMINCKQNIIDKFERKESFDKSEQISINSFCNSLNIIGEMSSFIILKFSSDDVCTTIYTCLDAFEKFCYTNIYAIRICEVLFYCLCNVIQGRPLTEEDKWCAVLWKYYNECTTSKQIKMAAAVSLTYIIKTDVAKDEMEKLKLFFDEIYQEMNKANGENYLGFSLQEIGDAMCRCRTKDDQTVNLKTNSILNLTTVENALTLCLKLNRTIYPCLWPKMDKFECYDASDNTLLHLAAVCLESDICTLLIEKDGSIIHKVNKEGNNCLQELFLNVDETEENVNIDQIIGTVEILIKFGIDLSEKTQTGSNIFQLASRLNSERLIVMLFTPTSSKNITESDFELSFERKWFEFVEKMLSEECLYKFIKADVIIKYLNDIPLDLMKSLFDKSDETFKMSILDDILYRAAIEDDEGWFNELLKLDRKTVKLCTNGETLLTNLIRDKKQKYFYYLIESNNIQKYIHKLNKNSQTPLQVAIEKDGIHFALKIILQLVNCIYLINNKDNKEETALTQLMKKMITDDIQIRNKLATVLGSMIKNDVKLYSITSDITNGRKNIKEMVQTILNTSEYKEEQIFQILKTLQSQKCCRCPSMIIEYVFECEHKFCSNCGEKIEECPFRHIK